MLRLNGIRKFVEVDIYLCGQFLVFLFVKKEESEIKLENISEIKFYLGVKYDYVVINVNLDIQF